jgi:beta-lactamase regulating signal transducer with metallopeptidase domain
MIPYILHVALLISVCLVFYRLLLRKETFYRLNRFVLISSLALSFLIPLVPMPQQWSFRSLRETVTNVIPTKNGQTVITEFPKATLSDKQSNLPVTLAPVVTPESAVAPPAPLLPRILKWTFYLYWIGVAVFALNFLLQLFVLLYRNYTKPFIKDGRFRIVELEGEKAPCSFGNTIFINPSKYDWETYNQILLHEKIHIEQGHSVDILLAELVIVFQWFNPFAWMYRKELENNLEFLTDKSVLHQEGVEKERYQMSLLHVSAPHYSLGLTTNYNQSLLKKRIAMMNAKQSNFHTMWKYFFLVPLMGCLMCALNDTAVFGQAKTAKEQSNSNQTHFNHDGSTDRSSGSWFATIKNDKLRIQFKSDEDENDWGSSSDFMLSEFSALPKDKTGEFTLTREAGTIVFKGKFEGNKGLGDYKFTANKEYVNNMSANGISGITEEESFAFFLINIRLDYAKMLKQNGYNVTKEELIPLAALKIDASFIAQWKENGFTDISANDLIATKSLGIDREYIADIRKAGYKNITVDQLISFKAQHISGDYINGLRKATNAEAEEKDTDIPDANDITAFKALEIDADFIKSFKDAGYKDISHSDLTALKSLNITPEFIRSFVPVGFKNIPISDVIALKSLNITPDFVKSFQSMGYTISQSDVTAVKSLGLTPEYIKGFQALGYAGGNINNFIPLKSLGITPEYINGFKKLGFNNISLDDLPGLKSVGVTPGFVQTMQEKGIKLSSLEKYIQLKVTIEQ